MQEVRLTIVLGPTWTPFAAVWPELELVFKDHQQILRQAWITSTPDLLFYLWRQDVIEVGGRRTPGMDLVPIVCPRSERYWRCWCFGDRFQHEASGQAYVDIHVRRRQQDEKPPAADPAPKSRLELRAEVLYGIWKEHGFDETWTAPIAFKKILDDPRYANSSLLACGAASRTKAWSLALRLRCERTK